MNEIMCQCGSSKIITFVSKLVEHEQHNIQKTAKNTLNEAKSQLFFVLERKMGKWKIVKKIHIYM